MKDWKTTVSGFLAATIPWLKHVVPQEYGSLVDAGATAALFALGWHAAQVK